MSFFFLCVPVLDLQPVQGVSPPCSDCCIHQLPPTLHAKKKYKGGSNMHSFKECQFFSLFFLGAVLAAVKSFISSHDCSRQSSMFTPWLSTPSTHSQHTCCHSSLKTNPKAAPALSVADRKASCHHILRGKVCSQVTNRVYLAFTTGDTQTPIQEHNTYHSDSRISFKSQRLHDFPSKLRPND